MVKARRMKMDNKGTSSGIGFIGLLTIVFIVLKLCKVITWSWLWVLSPIWISLILTALVIVIAALIISKDDDD